MYVSIHPNINSANSPLFTKSSAALIQDINSLSPTKPRGINGLFLIKPRGISICFSTKPRGIDRKHV